MPRPGGRSTAPPGASIAAEPHVELMHARNGPPSIPPAVVRAAIERSHLARLPRGTIAELLIGARPTQVEPGSTFRHVGQGGPHLELVITGLVRVFLEGADGRRLTVRYCRPGALLGAASLYRTGFSMPASLQGLVASRVLSLDPQRVRTAADRDPAVSQALLEELSERTLSFVAEITGAAFSTVRQRVARHLLDLASEAQRGSELRVLVTQQDLADAAGSVREVIVRVLRDLRQDGVVETSRDGVTIRSPEHLLASAAGESWNQGS